jgi:hypothetical protein
MLTTAATMHYHLGERQWRNRWKTMIASGFEVTRTAYIIDRYPGETIHLKRN